MKGKFWTSRSRIIILLSATFQKEMWVDVAPLLGARTHCSSGSWSSYQDVQRSWTSSDGTITVAFERRNTNGGSEIEKAWISTFNFYLVRSMTVSFALHKILCDSYPGTGSNQHASDCGVKGLSWYLAIWFREPRQNNSNEALMTKGFTTRTKRQSA